MMKSFLYAVITLCLFVASSAFAQQPKKQLVNLIISPDHKDWIYKVGEDVNIKITAVDLQNKPLKDLKVSYKIGPEKKDHTQSGELTLKGESAEMQVKGMNQPGFLRLSMTTNVNGKRYDHMITLGFSPLAIQPVVDLPTDFNLFWDKAKAEAKKIPLDTRLKLLPERCTEKVNVYEVNIQNDKLNSRIYGIVCIPKAPGKYPAILGVPSAGIKPVWGNVKQAEKGVITLEIGIHGIPVTLDTAVYKNLRGGALDHYPAFNLDDKDAFYFKRVYLGCVKAVDYIFSIPQFDGENIAVKGGSQGGALAIITAALDPRIKFLSSTHPALCDQVGQLQGRPSSWPNLFSGMSLPMNNKPEKIENSKYYDVINFARILKTPGFYTWGFNDTTCPATTTYSAYNVITAPKELKLYKDTGHWVYPEQYEDINLRVMKAIKANTGN